MLKLRDFEPQILTIPRSTIMVGLMFTCPYCAKSKLACFGATATRQTQDEILSSLQGDIVTPLDIIRPRLSPVIELKVQDSKVDWDYTCLLNHNPHGKAEGMYRVHFPGHWSGTIWRGELVS